MAYTLLVIDDSQTLRQQVIKTLQSVRLFDRYLEANNGLDGFKLLLDNPVDVILCDLEMPGMDGLKFLGLLNARQELKDLPVIMLTGHQEQKQKIKGLEQGASDYVTKPFDPDELVARVKVQLKIKHLQDDLQYLGRALQQHELEDPLQAFAQCGKVTTRAEEAP